MSIKVGDIVEFTDRQGVPEWATSSCVGLFAVVTKAAPHSAIRVTLLTGNERWSPTETQWWSVYECRKVGHVE